MDGIQALKKPSVVYTRQCAITILPPGLLLSLLSYYYPLTCTAPASPVLLLSSHLRCSCLSCPTTILSSALLLSLLSYYYPVTCAAPVSPGPVSLSLSGRHRDSCQDAVPQGSRDLKSNTTSWVRIPPRSKHPSGAHYEQTKPRFAQGCVSVKNVFA